MKALGIKIVWTVHNLVSHESNFRSSEYFFTKAISRHCDALIVHSASLKKVIQKTYQIHGNNIHVIPHGNFIDSYENTINSLSARKCLDIDPNDTVLVYFGRIRPYKGLDELLDAFSQLQRDDICLLIAGNPQSSRIKKRLLHESSKNNKIILELSFVKDNNIQIYLNAADIMILPYQDILTSGTAILGMGYKKPIIAPAIGNLTDLLDEKGSILYDPSEENALKNAIEKIIHMDLKTMGEHNYNLAKYNLDWDEIGKSTKSVYQSCLDLLPESKA